MNLRYSCQQIQYAVITHFINRDVLQNKNNINEDISNGKGL